jgi:hypothetical protein
MADHWEPLNEIRIRLDLENPDLEALAQAALNLHAAKEFACLHRLQTRQQRSITHRDLVLRIPSPTLHDTIRALRGFGIQFGVIECVDRFAYDECVAHGLWVKYIGPCDR